MQHIFRQLIAMGAGAAILALTLTAAGAFAQESAAPTNTQPVAVQGIVAQNHFFQYQGQLFNPNTGQPLANAAVNGSFRLYGQATGGAQLWFEDKVINTNVDGIFNTPLGNLNAIDQNLFDGRDLFLGVAINNEEGTPRLPIGYVPYAFWARNADKIDGLGSDELLRGITLAYGEIDENGNKVSGTDNWSSRIVVVDFESVYEVRINGVDYRERDYVTQVTPGCAKPRIMGTGSSEGALLVDIWNEDGDRRTDCKFQFTTFRKP
jgi:hypothetical protein